MEGKESMVQQHEDAAIATRYSLSMSERRYNLFGLVLLLSVAFMASHSRTYAQAFPITMGQINTCAGAFLDSGGQGGSGYGNNENFTAVICPTTAGDAISLQWVTFNLNTQGPNPIDRLRIWDGNSTAATYLGEYTGTQLQGLITSATTFNLTGCLTVQFISNGAGTGIFAAAITCYTPCERPTAEAVMSIPTPALVCMGEELTFDGSGSFPAPGFAIDQYNWDFADGTTATGPTATHAFDEPGEYIVQLYILDNNNCASTNLVDLQVLVSTVPSFTGTVQSVETCLGATVDLTGAVTATTWTGVPENNFGPPVLLPDDLGIPFTSEVSFTQFEPGQTLMNVSDLLSICVDMEHSFMGDLVISATCPNGQNVIFHQQGGGGTDLGIPGPGSNVGTCYTYCWSPSATNGTWVQNSGGTTLPAGTYQSLNPMSGFVGCPLNGTWTVTFVDLWAADDGWLCGWEVNVNPAIIPDVTTFTPVVGTTADSAFWTGPFLTPDPTNPLNATATPTGSGIFDYTFTATDNFGCTYDTTITVTIAPQIVIDAGPDIVLCNDPLPMAGALVANGAPPNCTYTLNLFDSGNNGWGGFIGAANVTLSVNGVATNYTVAAGSLATFTIPITPGATIVISYTAAALGGNNGQNSFNLTNDQGIVVYQSVNGPANGQLFSGIATCGGSTSPTQFQWSPATGLTNPTSLTTNVYTTSPTWYYLSAFPVGKPECAVVDSVLVSPDPSIDPGLDNTLTICASQPSFLMTDSLGGTPDLGGVWTNSGGANVPGTFSPLTGASGTYTYTVTSAAGCVATSELEITIIPADDPSCCGDVDAGEPAFSCTLSIELDATPGNTGVGIWTGPIGAQFDNASDPQTSVTMPAGSGGSHWFYWTENDGAFCFLVDSVEMTFTDPIIISFTTTDAVCYTYCDGTASAELVGGNPGVMNFAWSNGPSGAGTIAVTGLCAGSYSLTVTDAQGCTGSGSFTIEEPILLEIDAVTSIPETCFGSCDGSILITDAQAVEYSFDNGTTWDTSPLLESLCVGAFDLRIRDVSGCIGTGSTEITGPPPVVADFTWSPNPTNVNNPAIIFFNASTGAIRYEWDIAGLASTSTADAQYRFTDREPGVYEVCLTAFNSNECSDTVCYNVVIDDVLFVYVPNAFTPDGDDVNDTFHMSTSIGTITDFEMLIFDRWGQVVFETKDFGAGWNGKYRNSGEILPTGIYTYRINYAIPETSIRRQLMGSVTLLK
jgi:gliding motility-associated-like protein